MKFTDVLGLLGGLALFLYGMQMMSGGLEAAAGNRMKQILEKLTANRFLGVAVGTIITMLIQSSSATTVMVVGFINSGMMTLQQAVWIIMGANIGTTVTGQLIALDIGALAPAFAFAFLGVVMVVFLKSPRVHHFGQIIAGLGVLFIGMDMMSSSMMPLRESEAFISLMTRFSNPLLGILAGAAFTAVIQSSSASVGILQTLADNGLIGLSGAVYVLFGQNIGTCITAVLASIGTNRSAKRATIIHLMFNIIGTVLFTVICMATPLTAFIESLTPSRPAAQIANMHTLFNIATTLILLPFGTYLAALAKKILPELPTENEKEHHLEYLPQTTRETRIGSSAILLNGMGKELRRMMGMVTENVARSYDAVLDPRRRNMAELEDCEEYIDYLNKELAAHISRGIARETNERDSAIISAYFKISSDLERIGDHAMNIGGYTDRMEERHIRLTQGELDEIRQMRGVSMEAMNLLADDKCAPEDRLVKVAALEQKIDDMTAQFRQNQLERMKESDHPDEMSVLYSEMLTDFERIGDHALNIAQALMPSAFAPAATA